MPTFHFAKLVRDNIPGLHQAAGHTFDGRQLTGAELRNALCQKLHEEADEVSGALSRDELIEEIGDVQQVLDDLCASEGITQDELRAAVVEKTARKGGFQAGEYIETVTMPDENDKWVRYCRQAPEKYPEIQEIG